MLEYKIIKPLVVDLEDSLNRWGKLDWELVGFWKDRYRDDCEITVEYCTVVLQRDTT